MPKKLTYMGLFILALLLILVLTSRFYVTTTSDFIKKELGYNIAFNTINWLSIYAFSYLILDVLYPDVTAQVLIRLSSKRKATLKAIASKTIRLGVMVGVITAYMLIRLVSCRTMPLLPTTVVMLTSLMISLCLTLLLAEISHLLQLFGIGHLASNGLVWLIAVVASRYDYLPMSFSQDFVQAYVMMGQVTFPLVQLLQAIGLVLAGLCLNLAFSDRLEYYEQTLF